MLYLILLISSSPARDPSVLRLWTGEALLSPVLLDKSRVLCCQNNLGKKKKKKNTEQVTGRFCFATLMFTASINRSSRLASANAFMRRATQNERTRPFLIKWPARVSRRTFFGRCHFSVANIFLCIISPQRLRRCLIFFFFFGKTDSSAFPFSLAHF